MTTPAINKTCDCGDLARVRDELNGALGEGGVERFAAQQSGAETSSAWYVVAVRPARRKQRRRTLRGPNSTRAPKAVSASEYEELPAPAYKVLPAPEYKAAAELAAMGFGVYLPQMPCEQPARGRTLQPMLPGYVFVFTPGIARLAGILDTRADDPDQIANRYANSLAHAACIAGILRTAAGNSENAPFAVVPDEVIDRLRAIENKHIPLTIAVEASVCSKKKKSRIPRHARKIIQRAIGKGEIVKVRSRSVFTDSARLGPRGADEAFVPSLQQSAQT